MKPVTIFFLGEMVAFFMASIRFFIVGNVDEGLLFLTEAAISAIFSMLIEVKNEHFS